MCSVIVPRMKVVEMILVEDPRTTKKQHCWWLLLATELQALARVRARQVFLVRVVVGPMEWEDKSAWLMMTF